MKIWGAVGDLFTLRLSEEPHGAATCHHVFVPLLWVPVEPATQLASDSHTLVSSGVWKKKGREKTSSTRPSPTGSGSGRSSSRETAYLGTVALGLVRGDDHVGHDEEGVFLLQSGRRRESTAMSPSAEPSRVAKEARRSLNRTVPLTSPTCHAEHHLRNRSCGPPFSLMRVYNLTENRDSNKYFEYVRSQHYSQQPQGKNNPSVYRQMNGYTNCGLRLQRDTTQP